MTRTQQGLGGALATVVVWLLSMLTDAPIPPDVVLALASIFTIWAGLGLERRDRMRAGSFTEHTDGEVPRDE